MEKSFVANPVNYIPDKSQIKYCKSNIAIKGSWSLFCNTAYKLSEILKGQHLESLISFNERQMAAFLVISPNLENNKTRI